MVETIPNRKVKKELSEEKRFEQFAVKRATQVSEGRGCKGPEKSWSAPGTREGPVWLRAVGVREGWVRCAEALDAF